MVKFTVNFYQINTSMGTNSCNLCRCSTINIFQNYIELLESLNSQLPALFLTKRYYIFIQVIDNEPYDLISEGIFF